MSELQRVLAELDKREAADLATLNDKRAEFYADAARVIRELSAEVERLKQERDEARETVARLQETLEAYGDGGNEGPSMHAFLGDYQLIKETLGGSYTAEAFEALKDKAMELDELRIEVEAWREKPWAEQLRAQSATIAQLSARVALLEGYVNCSRG